jgi:hypothetical protein
MATGAKRHKLVLPQALLGNVVPTCFDDELGQPA